MKVEKWVDWDDAPTSDGLQLEWMGGWFNFTEKGQRWQDYLDTFGPELWVYLEAVREDIIAHHRRFSGDAHQHQGEGVPVFTDGKCLCLSFRAWGDLMAAIWSEQDQTDYSYMKFYM